MENEKRKHLVVIGTSDVHGQLLGFSYEDNLPKASCGLSRVMTYVEKTRKEADGVILLDAGDSLQGNILTDDICSHHKEGTHPVIAAMNALSYDAMTLGNHEFNWGIEQLMRSTAGAAFPILAANVLKEDGTLLTGKGSTILERCGIRIAIIGVVSPDVPFWEGNNEEIRNMTFLPAYGAVRKEKDKLQGQYDILIVSAHMGMEEEFLASDGGDSGRRILEENQGIDLLQVGHCHVTVSGTMGSTLYGAVRNEAPEVLRFDLYLEDGVLTEKAVSIVSMEDQEPSPLVASLPEVQKAHQATCEFASGTSESSILGCVTDDFQPKNTFLNVPEAYLGNTPLPDFLNYIQLEATGADVSAVPLFRQTSNLLKGNIFYKDIFNIYKFANTLCRVRMSGKELKKWLEYNASFYTTREEGVAFNKDFPYFAYDLFSGVHFDIDLSKPVGKRIQNATLQGKDLEEVASLTVAVAGYRFTTLVEGKGLIQAENEWQAPLSARDYIVAYFKSHSPVNPLDHLQDNWHLTGIDHPVFLSDGLGPH